MEEEDEIQAQACKFPRFGNGGRNDHPINNKIAPRDHHNILHNEDVENIGGGGGGGEVRTRRGVGGIGDGGTTTIPPTTANNNRLHNWHHSSRIIRVSRASGGKDRHSKVMTSKGLRDRRVRLSVTTAIQFYDLQDRLGYDQPSKAVEWLIKSAADAISELPSLNNTFPDTPKQLSDEKRGDLGLIEQGFADDSADAELDHGDEGNYNNTQQQQNQSQNLSLSKSACSSTSETSKGSGLSLSRSDIRVKARERARERAAKEKKKDTNTNTNTNNESLHQINAHHQHHQNMNPVSQTASFTELLTGGINNAAVQTTNSPTGSVHQNHGSDEPNNLFNKAAARQQQQHQWGSAPMEMDYFSPLFLGASSSSRTQQQHHQSSSSGFSSAPQFQLGHSLAEAMSFNVVSGGDSQNQNQNQNHHHHSSADQMQLPFSFIHDHLMPAVVTSSHQQPGGNNTNSHSHNNNDYNLNFTMLSSSSSLGLAGYNNNNRGTLQSNSSHPSSNNNNNNLLPHHHHHLQRFSVPTMDGSTVPFFFGAAAAAAPVASAAAAMESHNHHQHQLFSPVFDGRLQLCYGGGDGSRHSDQKGKAKN